MAEDRMLEILKTENLQLVEENFFRDKQGIARVKNKRHRTISTRTF